MARDSTTGIETDAVLDPDGGGGGIGPTPPQASASSANASGTIRRVVGSFSFDLNVRGRRIYVPLPAGTIAAYVAATPLSGTWATAGLFVRPAAPGSSGVAFGTAKTIAAGGGLATVTVDEAPGLSEIIVGMDSGTTPEASGVWANISVTADIKQ